MNSEYIIQCETELALNKLFERLQKSNIFQVKIKQNLLGKLATKIRVFLMKQK